MGVALMIAIPIGVRAIPPNDSDIAATDLLVRIEGSPSASYSGYAESLGTLQLPVTDRFNVVGELFGERTRMRVWWRDSDRWRVDKLLPTGEIDTYHRAGRVITWDYERGEVTTSADPAVRLPRVSDLLPPQIAYRLLDGARPDEVSRLPSARIAGQAAPGLRLTPADRRSTIAHVDVWADEDTGIPLRVEVYGEGEDAAAVSSEFMSFSSAAPEADLLAAPDPGDADYRHDGVIDIADATNRFAPIEAPQSLLGLPRSTSAPLRGVGVYGRGATRLVAIPLWDRAAEPLRRQLSLTPGSRRVQSGVLLGLGPLRVLMTGFWDGGGWLVSGTVDDQTLAEAAAVLHATFSVRRP
jgi:hypothetical protein